MKIKYELELEIEDSSKEYFNTRVTEHYMHMYNGDVEKVNKVMSENTFEKAIAEEIDDTICNYISDVLKCEIKIIQ